LSPGYNNNLGIILNRAQRPAEAVVPLRTAVALEPEWGTAHSNLGVAFYLQGKADEALEHLRRAVALTPRNPSYHRVLGHAYVLRRQFDDAMAEYQAAVKLQDVPIAEDLARIGFVHAVTGNKAQALLLLPQLRARAHADSTALWPLAILFLGLNQR